MQVRGRRIDPAGGLSRQAVGEGRGRAPIHFALPTSPDDARVESAMTTKLRNILEPTHHGALGLGDRLR